MLKIKKKIDVAHWLWWSLVSHRIRMVVLRFSLSVASLATSLFGSVQRSRLKIRGSCDVCVTVIMEQKYTYRPYFYLLSKLPTTYNPWLLAQRPFLFLAMFPGLDMAVTFPWNSLEHSGSVPLSIGVVAPASELWAWAFSRIFEEQFLAIVLFGASPLSSWVIGAKVPQGSGRKTGRDRGKKPKRSLKTKCIRIVVGG